MGYAGGWVVDGDCRSEGGVDPAWRRHGIARVLLARVADDAATGGARVRWKYVPQTPGPKRCMRPSATGAGPPPHYSDGRTPRHAGPLPPSPWQRFERCGG
ncbi:MAG: hypothetical protein ACLSGS_09990 [Adlercreutzia sp.]